MSAEPNEKVELTDVVLELHPNIIEHLMTLKATGLWGATIEEVAERALCQRLWDMLPEIQGCEGDMGG